MLDIKETRRSSNLLQGCVSERLLDDDVDEVLSHSVVLVGKLSTHVHCCHLILVNLDQALLPSVSGRPLVVFIDLDQSVDGLARDYELAKSFLERNPLGLDDSMDLGCLPELVWLDVKHILVDDFSFTKSQAILVGVKLDFISTLVRSFAPASRIMISTSTTSLASTSSSASLSV